MSWWWEENQDESRSPLQIGDSSPIRRPQQMDKKSSSGSNGSVGDSGRKRKTPPMMTFPRAGSPLPPAISPPPRKRPAPVHLNKPRTPPLLPPVVVLSTRPTKPGTPPLLPPRVVLSTRPTKPVKKHISKPVIQLDLDLVREYEIPDDLNKLPQVMFKPMSELSIAENKVYTIIYNKIKNKGELSAFKKIRRDRQMAMRQMEPRSV